MALDKELKGKHLQIRLTSTMHKEWKGLTTKHHINGSALIVSWMSK